MGIDNKNKIPHTLTKSSKMTLDRS